MKLTVVTCDCHQTLPHRKFKAENGGKSDGFFSLAEGKYILETLKDQGHLNEAEFAAVNQELTASGLPEFTIYGDAELDVLAKELVTDVPSSELAGYLPDFARKIGLSPQETELLRANLHLTPAEATT